MGVGRNVFQALAKLTSQCLSHAGCDATYPWMVSIRQHPSLIPISILGNCNTQIYLELQHEEDIVTARRALFLDREEESFLDKLRVGQGIVKIKGRTGPCLVRFPLVPVGRENGNDTELGGDAVAEAGLD